jgi:hypothetical protein
MTMTKTKQNRRALSKGHQFVQHVGDNQVVVNIKGAPTPARRMTATWSRVHVENDDFEFVFGQHLADQIKLISALIICAPIDKLSLPIMEMRSLLQGAPDGLQPVLGDENMQMPSERVVFERASMALFARSESEAEIAFYRIAPCDFAREDEDREFVYPVVSIFLSSRMLFGLVNQACSLIDEREGEA